MRTVLGYFLTGLVLVVGALVQIETLRQGVTTAVGSDPPRGDHPMGLACICPAHRVSRHRRMSGDAEAHSA